MIGFTLTMPSVGSWDGKWTDEDNLHYRSRKLPKDKETELKGKSFRYDFGDGWTAEISCKKVDVATDTKLTRKSAGFCGYDWMIDDVSLEVIIGRWTVEVLHSQLGQ